MSSRALRKLCNEPDIMLHDADIDEENDEEEEEGVDHAGTCSQQYAQTSQSKKKKKKKKKKEKNVNPFELLNDAEGVRSDEDERAEEEIAEAVNGHDENLQNGVTEGLQPAGEEKGKKKRKKKKKKQKGEEKAEEEDEIDASIREVNELLKSCGQASISSASTTDHVTRTGQSKPLLAVEHKHLNPENELRRIFGASVIRNEQRQRGRNRTHQKSTWLVTPKQTWPKMSRTGLSMEHLATEGRYQYFEFTHSKDYQGVQFDFEDAVSSMNPANIMNVLNLHPYHIDSLLQLSDVSRMNEDMGTAIDLLERALYAFESAFHPLFSVAEGLCQLKYRRPENRGLFVALFRHLTFLGQKGCNRTALEFCKLLLALQPSGDPLGVLLMMDYYALKSDEFDFLIKMFAEWEAHRNLSQLPNWAFSIAMAHFNLLNSSSSSTSSTSTPSTPVDTSKADALLQDALLMFPSVLLALLEKCSIQPDAAISSHTFFNQTSAKLPPQSALPQLVGLFVARNYSFWKESEAMRWLERNAREVIQRVNNADPKVKDYTEKREARYVGTPLNVYRHIFLSEHLGIKLNLPPELANVAMMSFDPLPPKDSEVSYTRPPARLRPVGGRQISGGILSEFLRSLAPTYTPPAPGEVAEEDAEANLGAAGGYLNQNSSLRQGVGAVMDAMRDLLQALEPLNREDGPDQLEELD